MLAVLVMAALVGSSVAQMGGAISQPGTPGQPSTAFRDPALGRYTGYFPYDDYYTNASFNFEQSVQGTGYFMTYVYAKAGNMKLKNYQHGSGSIDQESILQTYNLIRDTHQYDKDWNDFNQACIQFKETVNSMTYAPMKIAVGTGYYAANPLAYNSLLKERTEIKNYRAATSMINEIEYAHAIPRKDILIQAKETFNHTYDPTWEGSAVTSFKINEEVTDGKIHIGVLQGSTNSVAAATQTASGAFADATFGVDHRNAAWYKPSIEIDEDYFGTYNIQKNMTIEVPYKRVQKDEDWLPCCSGGWSDVPVYASKYFGSAKGIFDCTCPPLATQAQFPEAPKPA